jgi:succinyl-CoA synthetase alpha subunit
MSILVNKNTRVIVQGITGHEGGFHAQQMLSDGTNIVAGVSPGHSGEWVCSGKVPVFDSVRLATEATGANTSVIFVPARYAMDAILESTDSGIPLIVCITEGIPLLDMSRIKYYLQGKNTRLIGPNSPGLMTAEESKVGIIPTSLSLRGSVGIISRSGTLTYEVLYALKMKSLGTSTCVGIGGDPIIGSSFVDILELFEADPETESIVLIGEIGGQEEEKAAEYISTYCTKPVVSFIAGLTAPTGKRMGHAGAIIDGNKGTALSKMIALESAGVKIAKTPGEIADLIVK